MFVKPELSRTAIPGPWLSQRLRISLNKPCRPVFLTVSFATAPLDPPLPSILEGSSELTCEGTYKDRARVEYVNSVVTSMKFVKNRVQRISDQELLGR